MKDGRPFLMARRGFFASLSQISKRLEKIPESSRPLKLGRTRRKKMRSKILGT